jgi:hypothetical protein
MTILPTHIPLKDALTKESEQQGRALRVPEANIENEELLMSILIVTGIEGARNCAAVVGAQLGMEVEVADGRKAALTALRRSEFAAVRPVSRRSHLGSRRPGNSLAGQLRPLWGSQADAGDSRRLAPARAGAGAGPPGSRRSHESELKTTVAGLLLHSQLALSGSESSSPIADRLRIMADLAGNLRQQLNSPLQSRGDTAA